MTDRKAMVAVLKQVCVPALRAAGFQGAFPHFFRETGGFVALVTFQFASGGGSFCVNLGYSAQGWLNRFLKPTTDPAKLRVSQTQDWVRLGAVTGGDHWFVYASPSDTPYRGAIQPQEDLATRCTELLMTQAEAWWASRPGAPRR